MRRIDRRAEKAKADRQGYGLLAGVGLVVGAGVIAMAMNQPPERDEATGCLKDARVAVEHAVVVDRTEALSDGDQVVLSEALNALVVSLKAEERLTVWSFDGPEDATLVLDRCVPPKGSEVNGVFVNAAAADEAFSDYSGEVAKAFAAVSVPHKAEESHVVGAILKVVARLKYQGKAERQVLHVFSDFGEATKEGSFLKKKRPLDAAGFKAYVAKAGVDRLKDVVLDFHVMRTASTKGAMGERIKAAWASALEGLTFDWKAL